MNLRQLFEAEVGGKHLTFCFGRMNPPTIGHKQLLDTCAGVGGDYKIFVSQTQDKKKNPLNYTTKIKFIKLMFPDHAKNLIDDSSLNTIGKVASHVYNLG
jgi:nicotinamide mononucleotide adenylyltransferase